MFDLFMLETCPYCKKVIDFLEQNKIEYRKFDISDKDTENALINIGGKRQVPFLVDRARNVQMYESNDIIEYLKTIK